MSIPERNLNPPKDNWIECPDCDGDGKIYRGPEAFDYWTCPRCGGDGVISKAEEQREIDAAQGDKEYDAKRDREMEEGDTNEKT